MTAEWYCKHYSSIHQTYGYERVCVNIHLIRFPTANDCVVFNVTFTL